MDRVRLVSGQATGAHKELHIIGSVDYFGLKTRVGFLPHWVGNFFKSSYTSLKLSGEISEYFSITVLQSFGYPQAQVSMFLLIKANVNSGKLGCSYWEESILNVNVFNLVLFNI